MMSALKTGEIANSRMVNIVQRKREKEQNISVGRSGGGVLAGNRAGLLVGRLYSDEIHNLNQ